MPNISVTITDFLINSCPYFRNEVGGEKERLIGLSRKDNCTLMKVGGGVYYSSRNNGSGNVAMLSWEDNSHRSSLARGVALLEWPVGSHWNCSKCPLSSNAEAQSLLEAKDSGSDYYRRFFVGQGMILLVS